MMASIDQTIMAVALPTMITELNTSLALASWALIATQLTQTIVLPLAGKLGERWGRKRLLLWSILLFAAGSIGTGLSPSIYPLIACRVLQAVGGGMFFPCAAGIVGEVFGEKRQVAVGLFVTIFQIGGIVGPNVGGVITDTLSWRGIFFVNVPISAILLLLGFLMLPRDELPDDDNRPSIDTAGAALFAAGAFSLLFGLTYLANHPDDMAGPVPVVFLATGVFMLAMFLRQERRTAEPIIDLQMVRWRPFMACNLHLFMWSGAFNGFFNFIPYYAAVAYGMSATQGGAILTPRSIVAVIVSAVASIFVAKFGYRRPWLIGVYLMAGSMLAMGLLVPFAAGNDLASPFLIMSIVTCIAGLGIGIAIPPSQNAYFDLRPDQVAASAGFRAMAGNSGAVFGTTLVTLALSHIGDKAAGTEIIFVALGGVVLLSQIFVFMVPDKPKTPRFAPGAGSPGLAASSSR